MDRSGHVHVCAHTHTHTLKHLSQAADWEGIMLRGSFQWQASPEPPGAHAGGLNPPKGCDLVNPCDPQRLNSHEVTLLTSSAPWRKRTSQGSLAFVLISIVLRWEGQL